MALIPNSVAGIIPARYDSSRFPGKPLKSILDKPMIQHVYERCVESECLSHVYVATDDRRVREVVEGFGGNVIMTRADHQSGTDRLAEAAESVDSDVIVNIQGDQPFFDPLMIEEAVRPLLEDPTVHLSTLMVPIERDEDLRDADVVKVVVNLAGDALYFSRSLIPYPRNDIGQMVYEHVGLYVYRKETLQRIAALPMTALEKTESLEQLRWLEHGIPIKVIQTACADPAFSGFSIDTPADLERARNMLREQRAKN